MMTVQTKGQDLKTLIAIAQSLSPERSAQLIDFARFLEAQMLAEEIALEDATTDVEAENARWDSLLATSESQQLLNELADEALQAHREGETKTLSFDTEGRLIPE